MSHMNTRFLIVDTETTGTNIQEDRIVELAITELYQGKITPIYEQLFNPGFPIPPTASAVHHITDRDVQDKPDFVDVWDDIEKEIRKAEDTVLVAHNAQFDSTMLPFVKGIGWICTYRLARHVFKDAPAFGNQVLRYWLNLNIETGPSHRAMADTIVTAHVFNEILKTFPATMSSSEIIALANSPIEIQIMPFGKHHGKPLSEIPLDYIQWALKNMTDLDNDLRSSLEKQLEKQLA